MTSPGIDEPYVWQYCERQAVSDAWHKIGSFSQSSHYTVIRLAICVGSACQEALENLGRWCRNTISWVGDMTTPQESLAATGRSFERPGRRRGNDLPQCPLDIVNLPDPSIPERMRWINKRVNSLHEIPNKEWLKRIYFLQATCQIHLFFLQYYATHDFERLARQETEQFLHSAQQFWECYNNCQESQQPVRLAVQIDGSTGGMARHRKSSDPSQQVLVPPSHNSNGARAASLVTMVVDNAQEVPIIGTAASSSSSGYSAAAAAAASSSSSGFLAAERSSSAPPMTRNSSSALLASAVALAAAASDSTSPAPLISSVSSSSSTYSATTIHNSTHAVVTLAAAAAAAIDSANSAPTSSSSSAVSQEISNVSNDSDSDAAATAAAATAVSSSFSAVATLAAITVAAPAAAAGATAAAAASGSVSSSSASSTPSAATTESSSNTTATNTSEMSLKWWRKLQKRIQQNPLQSSVTNTSKPIFKWWLKPKLQSCATNASIIRWKQQRQLEKRPQQDLSQPSTSIITTAASSAATQSSSSVSSVMAAVATTHNSNSNATSLSETNSSSNDAVHAEENEGWVVVQSKWQRKLMTKRNSHEQPNNDLSAQRAPRQQNASINSGVPLQAITPDVMIHKRHNPGTATINSSVQRGDKSYKAVLMAPLQKATSEAATASHNSSSSSASNSDTEATVAASTDAVVTAAAATASDSVSSSSASSTSTASSPVTRVESAADPALREYSNHIIFAAADVTAFGRVAAATAENSAQMSSSSSSSSTSSTPSESLISSMSSSSIANPATTASSSASAVTAPATAVVVAAATATSHNASSFSTNNKDASSSTPASRTNTSRFTSWKKPTVLSGLLNSANNLLIRDRFGSLSLTYTMSTKSSPLFFSNSISSQSFFRLGSPEALRHRILPLYPSLTLKNDKQRAPNGSSHASIASSSNSSTAATANFAVSAAGNNRHNIHATLPTELIREQLQEIMQKYRVQKESRVPHMYLLLPAMLLTMLSYVQTNHNYNSHTNGETQDEGRSHLEDIV